jgi:hypothetical protein
MESRTQAGGQDWMERLLSLNESAPGVTRLLVRVRGGPGYRFHGLPRSLTRLIARVVHFIMQRKQLLGIRRHRAQAFG